MKILKSVWFTSGRHCIGIVMGQDKVTKEEKAYIGVGEGENQEVDEEFIATHGAKFPPEIARQLT